MLISEFARAAGLTPDTVRFYVKRGLLQPEAGRKGGANPYQVFNQAHVEMARVIKAAQSLGFTLREIATINSDFQARGIGRKEKIAILRERLTSLDERAAELDRMATYVRAKIAWTEGGEAGPQPTLTHPNGVVATMPCLPAKADPKSAAPRGRPAPAGSAAARRA